jgi:hypothetical protein
MVNVPNGESWVGLLMVNWYADDAEASSFRRAKKLAAKGLFSGFLTFESR